MKAKEINEGLFGDLSRAATSTLDAMKTRKNATKGLGSKISAFFKKGKYGRSTRDQLAADKFIEKFVTRGMEALNVAVKQGLVDPNSNMMSTAEVPKDQNQQPQTNEPTTQTTAPQSSQLAKGVEILDLEPIMIRYNKTNYILGDKGAWIKEKGNQPVPQSLAAFLNKQHDVALTQNQAKIDASKPPVQAKPTTPAKPTKATKKPVKKASKKPVVAKPRQTVAQKIEPQLKQQSLVKTAAQRNLPIKEAATYDKLNLLFESYIDLLEASSVPQGGGRIKGAGLSQTPNAIRKREARAANKASQAKSAAKPAAPAQQAAPAAPAQPAAPATQQDSEQIMSISQYFKENFLDSFLYGIDMTLAKPKIDALLKNLPQLYKSGQLKKELEDIGNIAFTLARK
jgi:hypothetical protein